MRYQQKPALVAAAAVFVVVLAIGAGAAFATSTFGPTQFAAASEATATAIATATVTPGTNVSADLALPLSDTTTETLHATFATVTATGSLTATKTSGPAIPSDGTFDVANGYWDMSFDGAFSDYITITVPYDPRLSDARAMKLVVKQLSADGTTWENVPLAFLGVDPAAHTITFATTSLTSFALAEPTGIDRVVRFSTPKSLVVPYSSWATIVVRATDASGAVLPNKTVIMSSSKDRVTWVATTTASPVAGKPGTYSAKMRPISGGRTFVKVTLVDDPFNTTSSITVTVTPKVWLSWPGIAASATRTTTVSGVIKPGHRAAVTLHMQRKIGSRWVTRLVLLKTNSAGKWATRVTFAPGTWRLRALASADAQHAASVGQWRTLYVY